MMKRIASLLLSSITQAVFAQSGEYALKGSLSSTTEGSTIFLITASADGSRTDSTVVDANGEFRFGARIEAPSKAYLLSGHSLGDAYKNPRITFYLEPMEIHATSPDSLANTRISGGGINADHNRYQESLAAIEKEQNDLYADYAALDKQARESDSARTAFTQRLKAISARRKEASKQFAVDNPNSLVALEAVIQSVGYPPDASEVEPLFLALTPIVRNTPQGKKYAAEIEVFKKTSIGQAAPVFIQADTLGNPFSLLDLRGKYVLLDFWASWCVGCREENPHLVAAFDKFRDKGFTVLGVSLDDERGKTAWLKAIANDKLQRWPHLSDLKGWKNEAAQLYGVKAIPTNYLIDPDGKIVAKDLRGQELEDKLMELLN